MLANIQTLQQEAVVLFSKQGLRSICCTACMRMCTTHIRHFIQMEGGNLIYYSPMKAVTLGLIIPLGRRWKSYSTESTTTVCPALLPPYRREEHKDFSILEKMTYKSGIDCSYKKLCHYLQY